MPLSQCNKAYLELNEGANIVELRDGIRKSQYCAYESNPVEEGCRVWYGAPIQILPPKSVLPSVISLASFGIGRDCGAERPAIFTRVAYYIPWIEANVWPFDRST